MKLSCLFLISLFWLVSLQAQPPQPDIRWVKTVGNTQVDGVMALTSTGDGGFIAGVYVSFTGGSTGDFSTTHGQNVEIGMIRYDAQRNVMWNKCYGGSDGDYISRIIQLKNGNFLMGGSTLSSDGDVSNKRWTNSDAWLLCIDSLGAPLWDSTYGSIGASGLGDLIQTLDGGYMLCIGSNQGTGDLDSVYGGNGGYGDGHLLKLDSNGNKEWVRNIGGTDADASPYIVQHADSSYYVTMYTESSNIDCVPDGFSLNGFPDPSDPPSKDIYVAKLDKSGNIIWHYNYGGSTIDNLQPGGGIFLANDTSLFVAGNSLSSNYMAVGNHGQNDILLLKIDTSGKLLWNKSIGGSLNDECYTIAPNGHGGCILVGRSRSDDFDVPQRFGNPTDNQDDGYVVNVDGSGNILWASSIGGSLDDLLRTACVLEDKQRIIVGGSTNSTDGNINQAVQGWNDGLLVELSHWPTSTTEIQKITSNISIFPNPAHQFINIQTNSESKTYVHILDITGRRLNQYSFYKETQIPLDNISSGIFFVEIYERKRQTYRRFKVVKY